MCLFIRECAEEVSLFDGPIYLFQQVKLVSCFAIAWDRCVFIGYEFEDFYRRDESVNHSSVYVLKFEFDDVVLADKNVLNGETPLYYGGELTDLRDDDEVEGLYDNVFGFLHSDLPLAEHSLSYGLPFRAPGSLRRKGSDSFECCFAFRYNMDMLFAWSIAQPIRFHPVFSFFSSDYYRNRR